MTETTPRNWWAILTAVLGAVTITSGLVALMLGSSDEAATVGLLGAIAPLVAGPLVLIGLHRWRSDRLAGSQLIVVGAVLTLVAGLELIPVGAAVLISGLWTGNLRLTGDDDAPQLQPVSQQQFDMTRTWFVWLGTAAVLFGIGWIPLVIEGDDLSWGYFIWILSWLGAIVASGVGIVLAGLRLVVRHRTRLA